VTEQPFRRPARGALRGTRAVALPILGEELERAGKS